MSETNPATSLQELEKELSEGLAQANAVAQVAESSKVESEPETAKAGTATAEPAEPPKPKESIRQRIKVALRERLGAPIGEMFRSMISPDRPTRRMSGLWLLSCLGIAAIVVLGVQHMRELRRAAQPSDFEIEEQARKVADAAKKKADEVRKKSSILTVGTFTVELKTNRALRPVAGGLKTVDLEIVLEFDSPETKESVEARLAETKSQLTSILTALDRDEVISPEGKRRLKRKILENLNDWLEEAKLQGKIEEIYFSKILLEP